MNSPRQSQMLGPLMRTVHWLLLLGWLFSSQGIAPALCLAAAFIDGDHAVKVGASDAGMTVVLSHDGKTEEELATHRHDLLCSLLVSLAGDSGSGRDHVLAFRAVDDASRFERGVLFKAPVAVSLTLWGTLERARVVPGWTCGIKRAHDASRFVASARPAGIRVMLC